MEAEYAFTKAVGEFCRELVREGTFKGNCDELEGTDGAEGQEKGGRR